MSSDRSGVSLGEGQLILVGGGVRSGKSRFALARAIAFPQTRRLFVATAQALDQEMVERIQKHRIERAAAFETFETIEEPLELPRLLEMLVEEGRPISRGEATTTLPETPSEVPVVVVDCLTLWVSNLIMQHRGSEAASDVDLDLDRAFAALERALLRRRAHVVMVTNEVGMGVVPESALGRLFRDAVGRLHQRLAAISDELYTAMMGVVLRLQPAPVAVMGVGGAFDHSGALDPRKRRS